MRLSTSTALLPDGYVEETTRHPVPNRTVVDSLSQGAFDIVVEHDTGGLQGQLRITFYAAVDTLPLERVLRLFGSLEFEVLEQRSLALRRPDGLLCRVHEFDLSLGPSGRDALDRLVDDTSAISDVLRAMWSEWAETDRLNTLILTAQLDWREVAVLRAYARYLKQTTLPYGQKRIETILLSRPDVSGALVKLFHALLAPDRRHVDKASHTDLLEYRTVVDLIENVEGLDAHRILQACLHLVIATERTNFYRPGTLGPDRPQLSFKFRSGEIEELPEPRPYREIFVYSPAMEGVHLRFGPVARGGLRWSDRLDDYRTEILGLAKAQVVKNSLIVPAGAKGGFVVRNSMSTGAIPQDDAHRRAMGISCYRQFIAGLLDVTDNRVDDALDVPQHDVGQDEIDSYLVVAADKGTATFSDIANAIAHEYRFWLGDAFASGGSVGYDHKKMGITARGAWVSATRHLAEMGIDIRTDPFSVAGIGDMSGDVFGNAMLLSRQIRLVAAFDHRHIFIDPTPLGEESWNERRRLFELSRSSWADYNPELISKGGGVWSRDSKSIPVTPEMRSALDLDPAITELSPLEMIRCILKSPVDLLFNGGVGTYVKSSNESHLEAGDKTNDGARIDASQLRARAVVEGGNLGLTPRARIEFAYNGGHINTDAIDNSAGVDCSDHEVNIKILLDSQQDDNRLDTSRRQAVLESLTDEVADLVLANNDAQNQILGEARSDAPQMLPVHADMVKVLEQRHGLDRDLESLPSDEQFYELHESHQGLTSPELATLLAHAKLGFKSDLSDSEVFADEYFAERLAMYFPSALRSRFDVTRHPLRTKILETEVVNDVFLYGGLTYAHRLQEETGAAPVDVVRAFVIVSEVFRIPQLHERIVRSSLSPALEYSLIREARRLLDRASRWFLANRPQPLSIGAEIERFRAVQDHFDMIHSWLRGDERLTVAQTEDAYVAAGIDPILARAVAEGLYRYSLLDILEVAYKAARPIPTVASVYFALSARLGVDKWLIRVSDLPRGDRWESLARLALREDLYRSLRLLTRDVVSTSHDSAAADSTIDSWETTHQATIERVRATLETIEATSGKNLASLSVAARHIRLMYDND